MLLVARPRVQIMAPSLNMSIPNNIKVKEQVHEILQSNDNKLNYTVQHQISKKQKERRWNTNWDHERWL